MCWVFCSAKVTSLFVNYFPVNLSSLARKIPSGACINCMHLSEVDQFKYLGSVIAADGGVEADVRHRVNERCKVLGAMK